MRVHVAAGYALLLLHLIVSAFLAPPAFGLWTGLAFGTGYFLLVWLCTGVYLSIVIHLGVAHRAFRLKPWFVNAMTCLNSVVAIHVNPTDWVDKHRNHHAFSDRHGDPHKVDGDGFWRTFYLSFISYPCLVDLSKDPQLERFATRIASNLYFQPVAHAASFALLWLVVRNWVYAFALWASVRCFALWVTMILNYWTHDRRFGTRPYTADRTNAVNIEDWLVVTATFSGCLQNNHHHHPNLARMTHHDSEYDFGLHVARLLRRLRLLEPSVTGVRLPPDVPLAELGL